MIKAGGRTIRYEIHKLSIWNEEVLPEWKESITVPIYKGDKTNLVNIGANQFANYVKNFIQHSDLNVNSICSEIIGDHQC